MFEVLLTESEVNEVLEHAPAPRVTEDFIKSQIRHIVFQQAFKTVTLCHIELLNGFSVCGESACVNPANFNKEVGESMAHKNAFAKLWPLFGFLLAEDQYRKTGAPA